MRSLQVVSDETICADASSAKSEAVQHLLATKADLKAEYLESSQAAPWIVGFSGGKDSTFLLQLVFEMLLSLPASQRTRPVHVLCNDTLVESPVVSAFVCQVLGRLRQAVDTLRLPMLVDTTKPKTEHSFWVLLLGRGYPAPNRTFRWCTDRMKIEPTGTYIQDLALAGGSVILLLGVRHAESSTRSASIHRYENTIRGRLNPHTHIKDCLVYRPIVNFSTEDVWQLLMQRPPPWGGTHRDLWTLYRNAQGGECPLVIDKSQAPSCGSSSSRFGCWTCTVVQKDRSLEGFIEAGEEFEYLSELAEYRELLIKFRDDPTRRMATRRSGEIRIQNDKLIAGPYTLSARKELLDRLLELQERVRLPLISEEEVVLIHQQWTKDAVTNLERMQKESVSGDIP